MEASNVAALAPTVNSALPAIETFNVTASTVLICTSPEPAMLILSVSAFNRLHVLCPNLPPPYYRESFGSEAGICFARANFELAIFDNRFDPRQNVVGCFNHHAFRVALTDVHACR